MEKIEDQSSLESTQASLRQRAQALLDSLSEDGDAMINLYIEAEKFAQAHPEVRNTELFKIIIGGADPKADFKQFDLPTGEVAKFLEECEAKMLDKVN